MQIFMRQTAVFLLLASGAYLSVRTRFFQLRPPFLWLREISRTFRCQTHRGEISPFQGICTALAATLGTGNIIGVATALTLGGPGAVFWMWISAVLGTMTAFAENALGALYSAHPKNHASAVGPMAYLEIGLNSLPLSNLYAFLCLLASFGIGNLCQSNSAAAVLKTAFGFSRIRTGALFAILAALVILGGIRAIAAFSEKIVPFMSVVYLTLCLSVLFVHRQRLPATLALIFQEAFTLRAGLGGGMFCAMRAGILRGIFSNEAGLGTTVLAHAPVAGQNPVRQGLWGIFEVVMDTLIVCTLTALSILVSGVYSPSVANGLQLTGNAFATVFGAAGPKLIAIVLLIFAFTTVVAWCSYGLQCVHYITQKPGADFLYKVVFVCALLPAAVLQPEAVWATSDMLNVLLVFPNLTGVLLLSHQVLFLLKPYSRQKITHKSDSE